VIAKGDAATETDRDRSEDQLAEYEAQDRWRDWDALLDRLPSLLGRTVLDLGCGPGLVSARLAARGAQVVGVDRNAAFLAAARRRCPPSCRFLEADLGDLDARDLPRADGLWSSFAAAYFPHFAPVLKRWTSCLAPGAWIALVEIDDLWRGHRPLPAEVRAAFAAFADHARATGEYDCRMGRRLGAVCREVGLAKVTESRWRDPELAFDGAAPPEILAAWRRFARLPAMKAYFGARRFGEIVETFLETIARSDHSATTAVVMVQAERPA